MGNKSMKDAYRARRTADEGGFRQWYDRVAGVLGISPDPDDPEHNYDYRAFYRDMLAGKAVSPDQPGGHFPSAYKTEGHPRTYLADRAGRVFDTRSGTYLDSTPVSDAELVASERAPDKPGYKPPSVALIQAFLARQRL